MKFFNKSKKEDDEINYSLADHYLLTKESYRIIAHVFLNENEKYNQLTREDFKEKVVESYINKLFENYVDKFILGYFQEHPELKLEEFTKSIDDEDELQRYVEANIPDIRKINLQFAEEYLASL